VLLHSDWEDRFGEQLLLLRRGLNSMKLEQPSQLDLQISQYCFLTKESQ
jgi:hypothetical protein